MKLEVLNKRKSFKHTVANSQNIVPVIFIMRLWYLCALLYKKHKTCLGNYFMIIFKHIQHDMWFKLLQDYDKYQIVLNNER